MLALRILRGHASDADDAVIESDEGGTLGGLTGAEFFPLGHAVLPEVQVAVDFVAAVFVADASVAAIDINAAIWGGGGPEGGYGGR